MIKKRLFLSLILMGFCIILLILLRIEKDNKREIEISEVGFDGPIFIVIQVHNRTYYLKELIESLRNVVGIEEAFLIFSLDFSDPSIDALIASVDFCRHTQIYFPYSIQKYPDQFPGQDPKDCPMNISKAEALQRRCNNADHPDQFQHYREAHVVQAKHHWWWKNVQVFKLNQVRLSNSFVIFLEEDHYVSKDMIYVYRKMQKICVLLPNCDLLSLGSYKKNPKYKKDMESTILLPWFSSQHNMGMAYNATTFDKILNCDYHFCTYDDYNWDWSLQQVSYNCLKRKLFTLVPDNPRVVHLGVSGGLHHNKPKLDWRKTLKKTKLFYEKNENNLFPLSIKLDNVYMYIVNDFKPYGGWGDIRDHALCLKIASE